MSDALRISDTFPGFSRDQWIAAVEKALKGQPISRISTKTVDGIEVEPLYPRAVGSSPLAMRAANAPWAIAQRVDSPDAAKANAAALNDLKNGADMLVLPFAGCASARGFGLAADKATIDKALSDVMLDLISIRLEGGVTGRVAALAFADLVAERGLDPAALAVSFGLDPIGTFASTGKMAPDWTERAKAMIESIKALQDKGFKGPFITADGRPYHDAGASDSQELGAVVATIVAYVRALEKAGFDTADAFGMIDVTLSVSANQFGSIAKLRSMRQLWANLLDASGVPFRPLTIHAETSFAMTTRLDPWVNTLRVSTAGFAAGVGGANSVCILPHTVAIGLPDDLARRIVRNLQVMLIEESNLYRVTDPAAGSGYVESLTTDLGAHAWELFQAIESAGGVVEALKSGLVQDAIAKSNETRNALIAKRKLALTGSSAFPNILEGDVDVEEATPIPLAVSTEAGESCAPLTVIRYSMPFEALRDAAKAAGEPTIFFAQLGRIAEFTARATWAKNFFEAGGIKTLAEETFMEPGAIGETFKASGARITCLVAADARYEEMGEAVASELKAAGAEMVWLAGRPKDIMDALSTAGVDAFCFEGCNVLGELKTIHEKLGIAPQAQG